MSCQKNDKSNLKTANTNPDTINIDFSKPFLGLDIDPDLSHDNIVAITDKESYPLNIDKISCVIKNNNVGKGFYSYEVPFIEQYKDGTWKRLSYQPPNLQTSRWLFFGEEGNKTKSNEGNLYFFPKYVQNELTSGKYRLVIFVGNNIIYAPFKFI